MDGGRGGEVIIDLGTFSGVDFLLGVAVLAIIVKGAGVL
jgi:hypothetical protein